jgi:tetratricopeptide (TPR) repeat protein
MSLPCFFLSRGASVGAVLLLIFGVATVGRAQTAQDRADYRNASELLDKGDAAGAEAVLSKLVERLPDTAVMYFARGLARHRQGKFEPSIEDLDAAIRLDPAMTDAFVVRANARAALSDYAGALADANTAVRLTHEREWRPLLARAEVQHTFGKTAEALADYSAALALDADNFETRYARADLQVDLGQPEEARADLLRLLESLPEDPRFHFRLAAAEFGLTHWDAARKSLSQAEHFGIPPADTARLWGMVLFAQGDFDGAATKLRAADPAHNAYAQILLHLALRRSGKTAPELKAALPAMEDKWASLVGYFLIGELKESELLATAEGKADPVKKRGQSCEAYYYVGQMRLLAGDRIAAKALFQQAIATGAKDYNEYTLAQAEVGR